MRLGTNIFFLFLISFSASSTYQALAQLLSLNGQFSGWIVGNTDKSIGKQFGVRYLPDVSLLKYFRHNYLIDGEFAVNGYQIWRATSPSTIQTDGDIKPYRIWLRFSSNQFETRIGLQKISFGSALLMRALMWFDRIDPRDPLQLTDGVYGMLLRYYFLNNTNVWFWGLLGNHKSKGWEIFPSKNNSLEGGGRLQIPFGTGEIAATYHYRTLDQGNSSISEINYLDETIPESRIALDGKWDVGIGLWFESVVLHQQTELFPLNFWHMLSVGADYTFKLGNGLHALSEFFLFETSSGFLKKGEGVSFSALLGDYLIGLSDHVFAIIYYDWKEKNTYRFFRWQRTYDNWSFHLISYWNPNQELWHQLPSGNKVFTGKGVQLMVAFNH